MIDKPPPPAPASGACCASSTYYDHVRRRVVLELTNGFLLGVPVARLPEIANAAVLQLTDVEVTDDGEKIRWDALDAEYHVATLAAALRLT